MTEIQFRLPGQATYYSVLAASRIAAYDVRNALRAQGFLADVI